MTKPLFARNIAFLRIRKGLTRRAAANASGIKFSTWGSYEEGRALPRIDKMKAICDTLEYFDVLAMMTKDLSVDDGQNIKQRAVEALIKIRELVSNAIK